MASPSFPSSSAIGSLPQFSPAPSPVEDKPTTSASSRPTFPEAPAHLRPTFPVLPTFPEVGAGTLVHQDTFSAHSPSLQHISTAVLSFNTINFMITSLRGVYAKNKERYKIQYVDLLNTLQQQTEELNKQIHTLNARLVKQPESKEDSESDNSQSASGDTDIAVRFQIDEYKGELQVVEKEYKELMMIGPDANRRYVANQKEIKQQIFELESLLQCSVKTDKFVISKLTSDTH